MNRRPPRLWQNAATLLLGVLLFWLFARQVNWVDGLDLLRRLGPTPILIYLAANCAIAILFANRWWLLLRGMGVHLPFGRVAVYRMIAATVSLLTPGPQFGGEPAQVYLLMRRSGVPAAPAIASVALDRLLELTVNLAFLAAGVIYTLWVGSFGTGTEIRTGMRTALLALLPLALVLLLLLLLWWRGNLLTRAAESSLAWLPQPWRTPIHSRLVVPMRQSETHIHTSLRQNPRIIVLGALVSVGNWAVLLADYWLATYLIGLRLDAAQIIGFVVAARIAILLPIPAGLGALEASQVIAAQRLGLNPAFGLGLVLLFRVRDVVLTLWGLWLAWRERNGDTSREGGREDRGETSRETSQKTNREARVEPQ